MNQGKSGVCEQGYLYAHESVYLYTYMCYIQEELDISTLERKITHGKLGLLYKCMFKSIFCALVLDSHLKTHLEHLKVDVWVLPLYASLHLCFEQAWGRGAGNRPKPPLKVYFCHRDDIYWHCIHLNLVTFRSAVKLSLISTFPLRIKWGCEMVSFGSTASKS